MTEETKKEETYIPDPSRSITAEEFYNHVKNLTQAANYEDAEKNLIEFISETNDEALNGNTLIAFGNIANLAAFSTEEIEFMNTNQISPINYLNTRFREIDVISDQIEFITNVEIAATNNDIKNPNNFSRKLISYEDYLNDEQKAKTYMLCADLHKPNVYLMQTYNAATAADYKYYLEKAINYTSDYDIVADCQRGLGNKKDKRIIKNAYLRVIKEAKRNIRNMHRKEKMQNIIYQANLKMAEIYKEDGIVPGFRPQSSEQFKALEKAEKYYEEAVKTGKLITGRYNINDLKNLANIQTHTHNKTGWIKTMEKKASQLSGKDKFKVLLDILPKSENPLEYSNMLATRISKGKISYKDKNELLEDLSKGINYCIKGEEQHIAEKNVSNARAAIAGNMKSLSSTNSY